MIGTKIYFEDNRTIVVFDNPTAELNEKIKKAFTVDPIDLLGTLITEKEEMTSKDEIPEDKEPDVDNVLAAANNLLHNTKEMKKIGLDQTNIILATALGEDISKLEEWSKTADYDNKVDCYNKLRTRILDKVK